MKNIITTVIFLAITFFSISSTIANNSNQGKEAMPAPEVIACEKQGTCEMTTLTLLLELDKEELSRGTKESTATKMVSKQ